MARSRTCRPRSDFAVEFLKSFDGNGGENILFCSRSASDDAGYVIAVQLVAASWCMIPSVRDIPARLGCPAADAAAQVW